MTASKDKIRIELQALINEGTAIFRAEVDKHDKKGRKKSESSKEDVGYVNISYQEWYTKALPVVRQLLPERYAEFQELYRNEKRKEITYLTYTISDYLFGISIKRGIEEVVNPLNAFVLKFQHQITILMSALTRIDSLLSDIKAILQAEFFDDELSVASAGSSGLLCKRGDPLATKIVAHSQDGLVNQRSPGQPLGFCGSPRSRYVRGLPQG